MATDLQVFQDTVSHRRPARILYHAGFTPDLERRVLEHVGGKGVGDIRRHYGFHGAWGIAPKRPPGEAPIDYSGYWHGRELPPGTKFDERGVAMVPSGFYHFWGYVSPLGNAASLREIEDYPLPDLSKWDCSHYAGLVPRLHAEGTVVSGSIGHMYEVSWQVRGYEQFLMDMVERPAWAECMLEKFFRNNLVKAVEAAKAGADMLNCGDDVANQNAMMFSPDLWRRMMLCRWRKVWQAAKEIDPRIKVWYHSDGNISQIIPDLIEAGVDILNPLQPECLDVDELHRRYGSRITFDGCIGTQSTMPFGTPEAVRARVREVIDKYGRDGGLIVSPTHVLEPDVPIANIDAFADACREYGALQ